MHRSDPSRWRHSHQFSSDSSSAERRTRIVVAITAIMMVVEISSGIVFKSMALLADGWHMSTHVAAFLITAIAYHFTRRHAHDPLYSFGTGKMGVLGGFASAVLLLVVAVLMAGESLHRLFAPEAIRFNEAITIATIGLGVNLVCALLLKDDHHHHHHGHGHQHHDHHDHAHSGEGHSHHAHDLNLRAAYLHVLADAFTSVTAIVALVAGKFYGWSWMDAVMGLVGSAVVSIWAYGLIRDTSGILLDRTPESSDLPAELRRAVEEDGSSIVSDLHVWQVTPGKFSAIVSIVAHEPRNSDFYREKFREHEELVHVTIEMQQCPGDHSPEAAVA